MVLSIKDIFPDISSSSSSSSSNVYFGTALQSYPTLLNGLNGYWNLDVDLINSFTSYPLTTVSTPKLTGELTLFNGSSAIYTNQSTLQQSGSFTITAWAFFIGYSTYQFILSSNDSTDGNHMYSLYYSPGNNSFHFIYGSLNILYTGLTPATYTPYFFTISIDTVNNIASFSINNGTPQTASLSGISIGSSGQPFSIGSYTTAILYPHIGGIWSIGIWSKVLTSTEITNLYNNGQALKYLISSIPTTSDPYISNVVFDISGINTTSVTIGGGTIAPTNISSYLTLDPTKKAIITNTNRSLVQGIDYGNNAALSLGSSDFTLESLVTCNAWDFGQLDYLATLFYKRGSTISYALVLYQDTPNCIRFYYFSDSTTIRDIKWTFTPANYGVYYIALVKSGATLECFVNGFSLGVQTFLGSGIYTTTDTLKIIGSLETGDTIAPNVYYLASRITKAARSIGLTYQFYSALLSTASALITRMLIGWSGNSNTSDLGSVTSSTCGATSNNAPIPISGIPHNLSFSGNQNTATSTRINETLTTLNQFSIGCWAYWNSFNYGGPWASWDSSSATSGQILLLNATGSSSSILEFIAAYNGNNNVGVYTTTGYILPNVWYYILCEWDGINNQIRMYVNNILIGTAAIPSGAVLNAGTDTFSLGGYNLNNSGGITDFNGYLAQVIVMSGNTTQIERDWLYNNGSGNLI